MAFKLTKKEQAARDEHVASLEIGNTRLAAAILACNEAIAAAWETLQEQLGTYNDTLAEVREWVDGIVESRTEEYDNKSDRWRDSDAGQAAEQWLSAYREIDLDDLDPAAPEPVDELDVGHRDDVENLPDDTN